MRAVVQRVTSATVRSRSDAAAEFETVGEVGPGMCVLVGVTHADSEVQADTLADKLAGLRIFDDEDGVMNVGATEVGAAFLVISQFTLYGDTSRGRRPSWVDAARPDHAEPLIARVVERLRAAGAVVETGRFRTEMEVELVNDGPVTLMLDVD